MGGRTLSYAQRFAGQETHRFLVVHAHEVGLQGRLRQELDRLLLGLLHELESGIDRFHADGEDRNLGRNRVEDRVTRGGHASVCARAASTAASVRDDGCLVRVCCYGYAVRRSGGAEVRCGGGGGGGARCEVFRAQSLSSTVRGMWQAACEVAWCAVARGLGLEGPGSSGLG